MARIIRGNLSVCQSIFIYFDHFNFIKKEVTKMYKVMINNRNADKPSFFALSDEEWNPDPEYCEPVDENIQTLEEAKKMAEKYAGRYHR